jgi:hypothetical protein
LQCLVDARLVGIANTHDIDVGEFLEIHDVLLADQPVSDESDSDTIVGAENALVGRGRQRSRPQESSPRGVCHGYNSSTNRINSA